MEDDFLFHLLSAFTGKCGLWIREESLSFAVLGEVASYTTFSFAHKSTV